MAWMCNSRLKICVFITGLLCLSFIFPKNIIAAEISSAPNFDDIAIFCDLNHIPQTVRVSDLQDGDRVSVYDADKNGNLLGESQINGDDDSFNVSLKETNKDLDALYISITSQGKLESERTKKPVRSVFSPVLEKRTILSTPATEGEIFQLSLAISKNSDIKNITLVYESTSENKHLDEHFVNLVENKETGTYNGTLLLKKDELKSGWKVAQISLRNAEDDRFIIVNAKDSWISNNQEHTDLSDLNVNFN